MGSVVLRRSVLVLAFTFFTSSACYCLLPTASLKISGQLRHAPLLLTATQVRFNVYSSEHSNDPLCSEDHSISLNSKLAFEVVLGSKNKCGRALYRNKAAKALWVELIEEAGQGERRMPLLMIPEGFKVVNSNWLAGRIGAELIIGGGDRNWNFPARLTSLPMKKSRLGSISGFISVKDFGAVGDGVADDTAAIRNALAALVDYQGIFFPNGTYVISDYLKVTNKHHILMLMSGSLKPVGNLNDSRTGLLHILDSSDIDIIPRVVNREYPSTLNIIRLDNCKKVSIRDGLIDVKYNSFDGTSAILLGDSNSDIEIEYNYICSGFGVLSHDSIGIRNITIARNMFEGQKRYGSLGTGDAIEFNGVDNPQSSIQIIQNRFFGYQAHQPGAPDARIILIGLSNTKGFVIEGNVIADSQMESVHLEFGSSDGLIRENIVFSGIIGVNLSPNSVDDLKNIAIFSNIISTGPQARIFSELEGGIDYGCGILLNPNTISIGTSRNISIAQNRLNGVKRSARGLCIYDVNNAVISNNTIVGFPRAGLDLRKFQDMGSGISNVITVDNRVENCGWNYVIGGLGGPGPVANLFFDRNNSGNSLFHVNYNSEISTRGSSTVRIPYLAPSVLSLSDGDILYKRDEQGKIVSEYLVTASGARGQWKATELPAKDGR